ncbi:MAG: C39 family peptidase [Patescibacteria group bacterium]
MRYKKKTKWWVWLIRIFFLIFLVLIWWNRFHTDEVPSFEEQILESVKETQSNEITKSLVVESIINDQEEKNVLLKVPFTPQAPYAEWDDDRFQDGCEEASVLMAMHWVNDDPLTKQKAKSAIIDMSAYQQENFGNYHDTDAADTIERLFKGYYKYDKVRVGYNFSVNDVKEELFANNLVLIPTNGRLLNNPYYTHPGPETHMLVIRGYDPKTNQFITNDPGTKRGEEYSYNVDTVLNAAIDYPTGNHDPIIEIKRAMIVVEK